MPNEGTVVKYEEYEGFAPLFSLCGMQENRGTPLKPALGYAGRDQLYHEQAYAPMIALHSK